MIIPWGKYSGEDLESIPNSYLEWLHQNMIIRHNRDQKIYDAIKLELTDRDEHGIWIDDPDWD